MFTDPLELFIALQDAFRIQVTPRPRPEDYSAPQRRSFVFFTTDDVESWIDDVKRAVKGANEIEEEPKSTSSFGSGFSSSLHQKPAASSTSYSTTTTKSKHSQRDFASFTDGDFVDTKVTFDSGVKLGGIRKDNGGFDDASALPMLAPPPARTGGNAPVQNFAPAPAAQQSTGNSVPSLEDFLGLSTTTSAAPAAPANGTMAPSPFAGGNFATAPSAPAANNANYNPFGGPAPAQPAANTSAAYMSAFYGSQPQAQNNPFAPAPQSYNFGAAPTVQQPVTASNTGYYGGFSAQPMQTAQPAADPFASFGAPPTAQPAQTSAQSNKPVDFFF